MNRTVYKHCMDTPMKRLMLSPDAKVVYVDEQDGQLMLWIECAPNHGNKVEFFFTVVATGREVPSNSHHVGTAHLKQSRTVYHVYLNKSHDHVNSAYRLNHT